MQSTDTERLDFIQRTQPDIVHRRGSFKGEWQLFTAQTDSTGAYFAGTLREAVDKAMRGEVSQGDEEIMR